MMLGLVFWYLFCSLTKMVNQFRHTPEHKAKMGIHCKNATNNLGLIYQSSSKKPVPAGPRGFGRVTP